MSKELPEIAKCACGSSAHTKPTLNLKSHYVQCASVDEYDCPRCWIGPDRKTERGAINAWNKVMEAGK